VPPPNTIEKPLTVRTISPQFRVQKRSFNTKPEWKQYLNPSVPTQKSETEYEEALTKRSEQIKQVVDSNRQHMESLKKKYKIHPGEQQRDIVSVKAVNLYKRNQEMIMKSVKLGERLYKNPNQSTIGKSVLSKYKAHGDDNLEKLDLDKLASLVKASQPVVK
jgi:hypothetical protein